MTGKRFTRAIRNNNPFNIKVGVNNWLHAKPLICNTDNNHVFEQFDNMVYGIRAGQKLLLNYIHLFGITTIHEIISRFAPSCENRTGYYVAFVCNDKYGNTILSPEDAIDTEDKFFHLCERICKMESGLNQIALSNLSLDASGQKRIYYQFFKSTPKYQFK